MKAVFRAYRGAGGFISASIAPVNESYTSRFSAVQAAVAVVVLLSSALVLHFVLVG